MSWLTPQTPQPSLTIVEPQNGAYISGPTRLEAKLDPVTTAVTRVEFFANGVLVCRLERAPYECSWDAGPSVKEHTVNAVAIFPNNSRLTASIKTLALEHAETVRVDTVLVPAVVTDGQGRFVKGLDRTVFRVLENGVPQTITHFEAEEAPLEVVIAVDISESMQKGMTKLRLAVKRCLSILKPTDRVTLVAFNDRMFVLTKSQTDIASRLGVLDSLVAMGGTALYDVIAHSIDLLERRISRKAVVVFTDGEDVSSQATVESVEQRIRESDATVYIITQGQGTRVARARKALERITALSGGRAFSIDDIDDLDQALRRVIEDLSHQYLLGYSPVNAERDGAYRSIGVEVLTRGLRVRARDGYRAIDRR